jgi:hypothetical protein
LVKIVLLPSKGEVSGEQIVLSRNRLLRDDIGPYLPRVGIVDDDRLLN